jgi:Ni,Fe-hydrogenase maturation factor
MKYLLCFGNPYLDEDNLAIRLADSFLKEKLAGNARFKAVEIVKCISPDEILNYAGKDFFILDVVKGIKEVMLIDDIDKLNVGSMVSLHDFDLGFFLKLMKETGRVERVKIIGIPQRGKVEEIRGRVSSFLSG